MRFPLTWLRCAMARSYAVCTDLRTLGFLPSMSRSLSTVSSIPSGSSLSRGSHCLQTHTQTDPFRPFTPAAARRRAPPRCVLPRPLGVKEEHQEELLALLRLPPLAQFEHLHGRHWDGDAVVKEAFLGHVRVNDLQQNAASVH